MINVKRKLSTILATDCASFSRYMVEDEVGTLRAMQSCREIIDPIISEHGGIIFHTAGDSVIAEFSSPVECVNAAIRFQEALAARNEIPQIPLKLMWRVGIHVDDVIVEGANIYGNGVNIAARLEAECDPGQILVSRIVQEQVSKRINAIVHAAGTRILKNISNDFPVFVIGGTAGQANFVIQENAESPPQPVTPTPVKTAYRKSKPKLAVMRFSNQSKGEESGFLVDGIFEDVITEFSMIKERDVVSRQSAINSQESGQSITAFVEAFEVDFLVGGSIRASGPRVRISAELTDTETGSVVWSNKFDRTIDDIFEIQDEIVVTISKAILGQIELASLARARRKPTESMNSYELLLKGKNLHHQFTKDANTEALLVLDKAIEADPFNAQAYAWKCCTLGQSMSKGWSKDPPELIFPVAENLINQALSLNENDFECHRLLCSINLMFGKFELAVQHGRRAFEMVPNDPRMISGYGEALLATDQVKHGLDLMQKALELDPVPNGQLNMDKRLDDVIFGYYLNGEYESCIQVFQKMEVPGFRPWLLVALASDKLSLQFRESKWFRLGSDKFKPSNLVQQIKNFRLQDKELVAEIISQAEQLLYPKLGSLTLTQEA